MRSQTGNGEDAVGMLPSCSMPRTADIAHWESGYVLPQFMCCAAERGGPVSENGSGKAGGGEAGGGGGTHKALNAAGQMIKSMYQSGEDGGGLLAKAPFLKRKVAGGSPSEVQFSSLPIGVVQRIAQGIRAGSLDYEKVPPTILDAYATRGLQLQRAQALQKAEQATRRAVTSTEIFIQVP